MTEADRAALLLAVDRKIAVRKRARDMAYRQYLDLNKEVEMLYRKRDEI